MLPLALALAAVLVVGCGALPNPFQPPPPPDALQRGPVPVPEPVPPVPADPARLGELARHRAVWDSLGIRDYTLTLMYGCQCELAGKPVAVTVVGGEIAAATVDGQSLDPTRLVGFPATVSALYAYAENNANAGKLEFAWDEARGIPTAIGIDPDLAARDDEIRIAVMEFLPAP